MRGPYRARAIGAGVLLGLLVAGVVAHTIGLGARPVAAAALSPARVALVIVPAVRLGPDHKLHDAFTPTDLVARAGQQVIVSVYNYDTGPHSFHAPALALDVAIAPAPHTGVPAVTVFRFSVRRPGVYRWHCMAPCDSAAQGWAMSHLGYMAGTITIVRA